MTDLLPTADDPARVIVGDALDVLRQLPDGCVHCCVTSPPYWGLRDYGVAGQIGLEPTPDQFVARLVEVFAEVWRVLHPSGTCWVNMGDSYASNPGNGRGGEGSGLTKGGKAPHRSGTSRNGSGLKPKDLCGVPWRLAFALQAAGWWLRSDIIWHKPSPMPESVTDRPTKSHEYVFMLTKKASYFYDAESIKEESVGSEKSWRFAAGWATSGDHTAANWNQGDRSGKLADRPDDAQRAGSRNKRTVWTIASDPYPEAHFATFPPALVEPMIKAGSSEKGVCPACYAPWVRVTEKVFKGDGNPNGYAERLAKGNVMKLSGAQLAAWKKANPDWVRDWQPSCKCPPADPIPSLILDAFCGSGTTLAVAVKLKRRALGIELNPEYAKLAEKRLAEPLGTGGLYDTGKPVVADLFDHLAPGPDDVEADGVSVG